MHVEESREFYSVEDIRRAYLRHAGQDDWGVPAMYENVLIAALRGEFDTPKRDGD